MNVLYTAVATATGDGRNGHTRSSDGLIDLDLAIPKEMGGTGGAANPEQLFAAGYAACFHSALKAVAQRQKQPSATPRSRPRSGSGPTTPAGSAWRSRCTWSSAASTRRRPTRWSRRRTRSAPTRTRPGATCRSPSRPPSPDVGHRTFRGRRSRLRRPRRAFRTRIPGSEQGVCAPSGMARRDRSTESTQRLEFLLGQESIPARTCRKLLRQG